jgi:peptide/nickel transport system ATP-binding protein
MEDQRGILLEVKGLKKYFPIQRGLLRRTVGYVKAVDEVSFSIREGETLGLVGESGSGKTTAGRCILRIVQPTAGEVLFRRDDQLISVPQLDRQALKSFRRDVQMIFQDPFSSLNPRMTVLENIGERLLVNGIVNRAELEERVRAVLLAVGLKVEHLRRYPHSFSGGQRQRIGIARALVLSPRLIVADEPVSALDVSMQAQIINLLQDLQDEFHLTYLFVAHDLSVVRHISNRVAVMYVGKVVELAQTEELVTNPKHPYTEALLSAVPRPDPDYRSQRIIMGGEAPDPADPPPGCVFHTRCRYAQAICTTEAPPLVEVAPRHYASCHFAATLGLRGIETMNDE